MKVFSQSPYFDSFKKSDKFYAVLYRPSYAVQARELSTEQSILRNQLENLGDHFFAEGAQVINGQMSFDTTIRYVKLQDTTVDVTKLVGQTIQGLTSGARADIITACNIENNEPATLFVKYRSSGENTQAQQFAIGESLSGADGLRVSAEDDALGVGSIAQIQNGIYYVRGLFAEVEEQTIILDKYGNVPSYRVGLKVNEKIVTPEEDPRLLDNAQGSYNYAAPGAHRYKLELILTKVGLGDVTDENFGKRVYARSAALTHINTCVDIVDIRFKIFHR